MNSSSSSSGMMIKYVQTSDWISSAPRWAECQQVEETMLSKGRCESEAYVVCVSDE